MIPPDPDPPATPPDAASKNATEAAAEAPRPTGTEAALKATPDAATEAARDAALDAAYRALPVDRPPPDFADRVIARHEAARHAATRRRRITLAALALAAAAALLLLAQPDPSADGAHEATTRTTLTLPARGLAVAEPGAALRWHTAGAMRVEQTRGRIFYRIDDGPLTVATPAGDITVRGTCFTVEVDPMPSRLKTAALGALAGAAVTVAVYEGRVALQNDRGTLELAAGDHARMAPDTPPRRTPPPPPVAAIAPIAPIAPVPPTDAIAPTAPIAPATAPPELLAEVEALRSELTTLRRQLDDERTLRLDTEGEPVAFPPELPDHFREPTLRRNFQAALEEAGLDGEIKSIDCSEFPCIVYGDVANPDDRALDALTETEAMKAYKDAANNTSAWGRRLDEGESEDTRRTFFGIALMPKHTTEDPTHRSEIGKRLRFRNEQAFEAFRPEIEPPPE